MAGREAVRHAAHQKDHGKLQALGPVDGQDVDSVLIQVGLSHGRIVAGGDEIVHVFDKLRNAVVGCDLAIAGDKVEELRQVGHTDFILRRAAGGQPAHIPGARDQILVQHAAGGVIGHDLPHFFQIV